VLFAQSSDAAGAPVDQLTFLSSDKLALDFPEHDGSVTAEVALANAGDLNRDVTFELLLFREGKAVSVPITVSTGQRSIDAHATQVFSLMFKLTGTTDPAAGFLLARSTGVGPASREVSVRVDERIVKFTGGTFTFASLAVPGGPGAILGIGFAAGFLLVVARSRTGKYKLSKQMGPRKFKFTESFASTFTGLGAFFGTALSAGILPDEPELLAKSQFVALNLLFALILIVGASIYELFEDRNGKGRVWAFLLAAAVTFWAVYGELLTLFLLLGDASTKFGSRVLTVSFDVLALVLIIALTVYGWRAIHAAYKTGIAKRPYPPEHGRRAATEYVIAADADTSKWPRTEQAWVAL